MRVCKKCNIARELNLFSKNKLCKLGRKYICKHCDKVYKKAYYKSEKGREVIGSWMEKHKEERATSAKLRYLADKEARDSYKQRYRDTHKDQIRLYNAKYAEENPEIVAAKGAKRRALELSATPPDANQNTIKALYMQARRLTKCLGIQYHVDHIIPLSKGGLHHQDNLQVITAKENLSKGAKLPEHFYG